MQHSALHAAMGTSACSLTRTSGSPERWMSSEKRKASRKCIAASGFSPPAARMCVCVHRYAVSKLRSVFTHDPATYRALVTDRPDT